MPKKRTGIVENGSAGLQSKRQQHNTNYRGTYVENNDSPKMQRLLLAPKGIPKIQTGHACGDGRGRNA